MELYTSRLILRDFVKADWRAVLAYQSKPEYLRYYEWDTRSAGAVQSFVQMFVDSQDETPRRSFQLALTVRESGVLIGNAGVRVRDVVMRQADMGYELDPAYWGQGYATEAARAVLAYGFTELKMHRVWAACVADNVGSAHVLEKIGMQLEGRLREQAYYKGRWWDTLMYSVLEHEWRAV